MDNIATADRVYDRFSQLRRANLVLMRGALSEVFTDDGVIHQGYSGRLLLPPISHVVRVRIGDPVATRLSLTMERLE